MKAHSAESIYELSSKFGAEDAETGMLLCQVAAVRRRPGLAFNVGSMCLHLDAYRRAYEAHQQGLRELAVQRQAGLVQVDVDEPVVQQLSQLFETGALVV